jgi:P27 family predicted phage terminase small subunit
MANRVKGGRRGHKPCVPTALKRLRGTAQPCREEKRQFEPVPELDLASEPPPWLTDEQQASWRYAMVHAPRGLLKGTDRGPLVAWCVAESRHRTAAMAQARIDHGKDWPLLQPGKDGRAVISPYVTIMERSELIMLRIASELGFTPASRPRLQLIPGAAPPPLIDGEAELDPWDALGRLHGRDAA